MLGGKIGCLWDGLAYPQVTQQNGAKVWVHRIHVMLTSPFWNLQFWGNYSAWRTYPHPLLFMGPCCVKIWGSFTIFYLTLVPLYLVWMQGLLLFFPCAFWGACECAGRFLLPRPGPNSLCSTARCIFPVKKTIPTSPLPVDCWARINNQWN